VLTPCWALWRRRGYVSEEREEVKKGRKNANPLEKNNRFANNFTLTELP